MKELSRKLQVIGGALLVACTPAKGQQVTGTAGSPSATTRLTGKQLPPPDPKFGGIIDDRASKSKAWWAPRVVPPKNAPNVLLIMTDDSGYGLRVPSAELYRRPRWIALRTAGCVIPIFILPPSARLPAQR